MKLPNVEISAVNKRKWIETRSALLWRCPAFTHILFSMLNPTKGELAAVFTDKVPIAATDGSNLILNPDTFFEYPLDERVFIIAHEILHCIFNHCTLSFPMMRSGQVKYADGLVIPFHKTAMNVAMDLVINDILIDDKIGKFPEDGLHDTSIATKDDTFLDAYRKLYEKYKKPENGSAPGDAPGDGFGDGLEGMGKGFDIVLEPGAAAGQDPAQATQERSQIEWDTAVAAAIASARLQGKLPGNLERLLSAIIEPTVPWQDHIQTLLARRVGSGRYDWRNPDRVWMRRDIYMPRKSGNGCGVIVVGVDTSGSIGQPQLDVFFGEMRGILDDMCPTEIHVVWCDSEVHHVDTVNDSQDISGLKAYGGGGTAFEPVFKWVDNLPQAPDALIYLTDGFGSFPSAPTYPVIWGSISKDVEYPFGDTVFIPVK